MDKDWQQRLKNFDRVWKRVTAERAGQKNSPCPIMPKKQQSGRGRQRFRT